MTISDLRQRYALPASMNSAAVMNHAIRQTPGGSQVLQALTRLHEMQHGRTRPDPALQELLDLLRSARDAIATSIKAGGSL